MDTEESSTEAMDDTHARLLALEMVTSAVLNQIAREDSRVMSVLEQLASPTKLPDSEAAGGADGLARLQANVARLASAITARL
ncbi:hypothetical protein [Phenylobacterium sp.]|uniref:hypothetical protein n=1 Tax=Phenylobacterium sp. TaxID=1871053 RepID=UPI0025F09D0B|nr:hypothetical protein [Phenylobacterium sp.]